MAEAASPTPGAAPPPQPLSALRSARGQRAIAAALIVAAVALELDSMERGLECDDNVYTFLIGRHLAGDVRGPWYEIASLSNPDGPDGIARLVDEGFLPWWSDPGLKWALFRPAALLTHFLDMWAWPDSPATMHAHNLLWYAALLSAAAWLYRRMAVGSAAGLSALVALAYYCFNVTNAAVASWIATRNAMMAALLCVLCVALHDVGRSRQGRGQLPWLLGSALCLLTSMLSSEGGIAAWGYLVAHALWVDRGPVRQRALGLLPALGATLLWIAGYRGLGFGTAGGGLYLDPMAEPLAFAAELPERMAWLLNELLGLPSGMESLHPSVEVVSYGFGAVGLTLLCVWSLADRRMRFWMGGCIASLIPWCAGYPTYRMLMIPAIGAFGALGYATALIVTARPRLLSRLPIVARRVSAAALLSLVVLWGVLHVPVSIALSPKIGHERQRLEHILDQLALSMPADGPGRTMILLNSPSFVTTMFATFYRARDPFAAGRAYTLSASLHPVLLSRPSQDSLRMHAEAGLLTEFTSQLPRSAHAPFAVGERIAMGPATAVVERLTRDGRPLTVRFDFRDLTDPSLLWTTVHWVGPEMRASPVRLPPVGGATQLPTVMPR